MIMKWKKRGGGNHTTVDLHFKIIELDTNETRTKRLIKSRS